MSQPYQSPGPSVCKQPSLAPDNGRLSARSRREMQQQILVALGSQLIGILIMVFIVWIGYAQPLPVAIWAPLSMVVSLSALLAVTFDWNRWISYSGWTFAQIAWSMTSTVACYAMVGPLRAIVFPMTCLSLLFSIFSLPARAVRWLTGYALLLFAITMSIMTLRYPETYRWTDEAATFAILILTLPSFALLATRMSALRARLLDQRKQLKHALEKIQVLADTDELTGQFNRRYMLNVLAGAEARAATGHGVFVAMIDLDRFKVINDSYGHFVGDDVLRSFAQAAKNSLHESEIIGRWGGEEFLLILDTNDAAVAYDAVERIRREVEKTRVEVVGGEPIRYTISVGLSQHAVGETIMDCVDRVDRLLYEAKSTGRNRVVANSVAHPAQTATV